jgi:pimeloyl-ACP methyl ester carboxylesterase
MTTDGALRSFMSHDPAFLPVQKARYAGQSSHLTMVLGGTITQTSTLFLQMTPELREEGDVLVINYGTKRFKEPKLVAMMVDYIKASNYTTVAIVGTSLGGRVDYDVQLKARAEGLRQEILAVLIDTPPNASYLSDWRARIPGWFIFPFGPIFNQFSRTAIKLPYVMPDWDNLGEGHDRRLIENNLEATFAMKLSVLHDQINYLRHAAKPKKGEAAGLKAVYLRSGNDEALEADSYVPFEESYGDGFMLIDLPGATHAGLLEFPVLFNRNVRQAISEFKSAAA